MKTVNLQPGKVKNKIFASFIIIIILVLSASVLKVGRSSAGSSFIAPIITAEGSLTITDTILPVDTSLSFALFQENKLEEGDILSIHYSFRSNSTTRLSVFIEEYINSFAGLNNNLFQGKTTLDNTIHEFPEEERSRHLAYKINGDNNSITRNIHGFLEINQLLKTAVSFKFALFYKVLKYPDYPETETHTLDISYLPELPFWDLHQPFSFEVTAEWNIIFPWPALYNRKAAITIVAILGVNETKTTFTVHWNENSIRDEFYQSPSIKTEINDTEILEQNSLRFDSSNMGSIKPQSITVSILSEEETSFLNINFTDPVLGILIGIGTWIFYLLTMKSRFKRTKKIS